MSNIEKIGIVGGGQLGRMLTQAAIPMGYEVMVTDPAENSPAFQVGAEQIEAALTDTEAIGYLASQTDVLTWEIEHIPAEYLISLANHGYDVQSSPETLAIIQDKLIQKLFLQSHGIPVAPFSGLLDEELFIGGGPYVVKTRRGGYDGRGNLVVDSLDDPAIVDTFGDKELYVEQAVVFEKELAIVAARDKEGNIVTYPTVETIHKNNICHIVRSPAPVDPDILKEADDVARATLQHLEGAGIFAIELFLVNGEILVNEIAPRVHNSGHLTIEANETSQFQQHIRAITGMPLGSTEMTAPAAVMINILGQRDEPMNDGGVSDVEKMPGTTVNLYGKAPRPARKIGHITVLADTLAEAEATAITARNSLNI